MYAAGDIFRPNGTGGTVDKIGGSDRSVLSQEWPTWPTTDWPGANVADVFCPAMVWVGG